MKGSFKFSIFEKPVIICSFVPIISIFINSNSYSLGLLLSIVYGLILIFSLWLYSVTKTLSKWNLTVGHIYIVVKNPYNYTSKSSGKYRNALIRDVKDNERVLEFRLGKDKIPSQGEMFYMTRSMEFSRLKFTEMIKVEQWILNRDIDECFLESINLS